MLKSQTLLQRYALREYKGEVGIEIEMEGEFLSPPVGRWGSKPDGSLRAGGVEYVTKGPINKEDIAPALVQLWEAFRNANSVLNPSDRCGVHVHLNCQNYNFEEIWRIVTVSLMLEDILLEFCGETRNGNLFCLGTKDANGLLLQLVRDREAGGRFETLQSATHFRYGFINFCVLPTYGSLEYRSLQTEKEFDNILTWTEMLLAIRDYALSHDPLFGVMANISMYGIDNFLLDIFGKKNAEILKKANSHYARIILDNIRRIQVLVYSEIKDKKQKTKNDSRSDQTTRLISLETAAYLARTRSSTVSGTGTIPVSAAHDPEADEEEEYLQSLELYEDGEEDDGTF